MLVVEGSSNGDLHGRAEFCSRSCSRRRYDCCGVGDCRNLRPWSWSSRLRSTSGCSTRCATCDPLTTAGLVVIFVIFFLSQRQDLRDRLIRLAGSHDLQRTTDAINDGAERLSRYFLAQTALNVLFGLIVGIALTLIGVPNPVLFGILAMVLRFVPYIGAFIAAIFPIALAVAVDPGWSMALMTTALFLVVEPLIGQVIEPLVYGHSTGLTPVAVIIAATFWTWLWGPIGLLLSTPLTVCLGVLGRHIPWLRFLDVMIGDEPPLSPAQSFYQRARRRLRDRRHISPDKRRVLDPGPVRELLPSIDVFIQIAVPSAHLRAAQN